MASKKPPSPLDVITTAQPGSPEWMNAFSQLNPEDQATIFNQVAPAFNFEGAVSDGQFSDPTMIDQGAEIDTSQLDPLTGGPGFGRAGTSYSLPAGMAGMQPSIDPTSQQILQFGGPNIPSYTAAGKLDPRDLGQEAQMQNLYQDQVSSLGDLLMSAIAGPGAIDPSTFAPNVQMPTEKLSTPGMDKLNRYASGSGYKAYIAKKMQAGETDDEAFADLMAYVTAPETATASQADKAARDEVRNSMPPNSFQQNPQTTAELSVIANRLGMSPAELTQPTTGTGAKQATADYNLNDVQNFASGLFNDVSTDRSNLANAWQDPNSGTYYTSAPVETPSAATTKFRNLGLPTPFEQYTDPKFLNPALQAAAPNLGAEMQAGEQARLAAQSDFERAQQRAQNTSLNAQDLVDAWNKMYPDTSGAAASALRGDIGALPENAGRMSAADQLTSALASMPEFAGGGAQPAPSLTPPKTYPGINLGGRVTGTSLGNYMGRVATQPAPTGEKNQLTGVVDEGTKRVGGNPQYFYVTDDQGRVHLSTDNSKLAGQGRPIGPDPLTSAIFNFAPPQNFVTTGNRAQGQPLTNRYVQQSQAQARQANQDFTNANIQRFRANQYTPPDVGAAIDAWERANVMANVAHRTPFQDAIIQRLLGQRAVGLRGA